MRESVSGARGQEGAPAGAALRGSRARWIVALALASQAVAAPVRAAQRGDVENKAFEDKSEGYRLKTPKGWIVIPVAPDDRELGLAFQADSDGKIAPLGRFRVVAVETANDLKQWNKRIVAEIRPDAGGFESEKPEVDEKVAVGVLQAHHRRWQHRDLFVDTWVFEREDDRIGVIGTVSAQDRFANSWLSAFERTARSFETFAPVALGPGTGNTYEERLAAVRAEAERTKGWRVVPTPSKKFILTTSCDNQKFVDEVIDRLERSRLVFEEDYPPPPDFGHVSVVRLCAKEDEFHRYGNTSEGVMGWFNPGSTELVLFDAKEVDRNMSYAVMTHEAFHQYCHFLFGRSEAHRWFDEGHGDYYGGMKFAENGKPKITARMPGGLDRLPGIREMLQAETFAPLAKHLNYDHGQWQNQGPGNTGCYEQSWSIIYMLRQGMLGKVNSKVWRKEYAEILPHYIETLRKGFDDAYRAERAKRLAEEGKADETTAEVIELDSTDLGEKTVARIWKDAMAASFGKVDLDQFEEDWKLYVKKYLKD